MHHRALSESEREPRKLLSPLKGDHYGGGCGRSAARLPLPDDPAPRKFSASRVNTELPAKWRHLGWAISNGRGQGAGRPQNRHADHTTSLRTDPRRRQADQGEDEPGFVHPHEYRARLIRDPASALPRLLGAPRRRQNSARPARRTARRPGSHADRSTGHLLAGSLAAHSQPRMAPRLRYRCGEPHPARRPGSLRCSAILAPAQRQSVLP